MSESFFTGKRVDFYRPLTRPWRIALEQVLIALYESFFGRRQSLSHSIERDALKAIVLDALQRTPMLTREGDERETQLLEETDESVRANAVIRELVEYDYLAEFLDTVSMRTRFRFTPHGKTIARSFAEHGRPEFRMPQKNVRNTRASLLAYLRDGDPYDLFTAAEHSRNIVLDFSAAEDELRELQRQIIAGASREYALTGYMDYMKKKFVPDHAIRASIDSVDRFRKEIAEAIRALKIRPAEQLAKLERSARETRPDLVRESGSLVLDTLNEIQQHLDDAMAHRMPSLLAAAGDFGNRASFVAIQASIVAGASGMSAIAALGDRLKKLSSDGQDTVFDRLLLDVAPVAHGLVDDSMVRLRKGPERVLVQNVQPIQVETREERREAYIRRALAVEFCVSMGDIRAKVLEHVARATAKQIRLSDLPVETYSDILVLTHAVEAACVSNAKTSLLDVEPVGTVSERGPLEFEDMIIRPARSS